MLELANGMYESIIEKGEGPQFSLKGKIKNMRSRVVRIFIFRTRGWVQAFIL